MHARSNFTRGFVQPSCCCCCDRCRGWFGRKLQLNSVVEVKDHLERREVFESVFIEEAVEEEPCNCETNFPGPSRVVSAFKL